MFLRGKKSFFLVEMTKKLCELGATAKKISSCDDGEVVLLLLLLSLSSSLLSHEFGDDLVVAAAVAVHAVLEWCCTCFPMCMK